VPQCPIAGDATGLKLLQCYRGTRALTVTGTKTIQSALELIQYIKHDTWDYNGRFDISFA